MFGFRLLRVLAPLAVVCGALFAVSCGNNNASLTTAVSYPTSAADTVSLTGTGTIPLPAVSPGTSVTLNYIGANAAGFPSPVPSNGITLTTTILSAPPANAPAPTSAKRTTLSRSNAVSVMSVTFSVSTALPGNVISGETLSLAPSQPINQPYFVELDDLTSPAGQQYINTYPGSAVTGSATSFVHANGFVAGTDLSKYTFNASDTYLLQFYYLTTGTPATPSPSPSAAVSAGPAPTPVVVATTEPMGAAQSFVLPVVAGGFVASVNVAAAGTSATSLTTSGAPQLPTGISSVGTTNSLYPFYVLGLTASGSVAVASPQFTLQLPTNFTSSSNSQIFAALCTTAACPVDAQDSAIAPDDVNGLLTFSGGAFPGFTGVSTTPQYIVVYSSRGTPAGQSATVQFAAGAAGSIAVPSITSTQPTIAGTYTSTVNLSGLGTAAAVTVAAQTGLFSGISAIVPNTQQIFYALALNASPQVTLPGLACGTSGCSSVVLTVPSTLVTALAGTQSFYVEECAATACPISSADQLALKANASNQLLVPPTFGTDITSLYPAGAAGTAYLVFYYQ
jgi:hypothetical protein